MFMCRLVCWAHRRHLFDAAICAHVGSEDVSIQLHRDATDGHFNSPDIFVIYKALCFDVAQGRINRAPNETRTHLV